VAHLLGLNVYRGVGDGTAVTLDGGGHLVPADAPQGPAVVTVAPGAIALHTDEPHGSPRNVWRTRVTTVEQVGSNVRVGLAAPPAALADLTRGAAAELGLTPGIEVWASVKANEVHAEPD
jgi:molybdate transport system ATP-binding protein